MAANRFYPRLGPSQTFTAGTATSTTVTNAFGAQTYGVRIAVASSTTAAAIGARFKIGNGTLTIAATDAFLPAGSYEYLAVTPGQKIAAQADTVTCTFSVTELV